MCYVTVSALLQTNPRERLGKNGAAEVMKHSWFYDIDWLRLESKEDRITVPYDFYNDYNVLHARTPSRQYKARESISSAESIDSDQNAKYFADF